MSRPKFARRGGGNPDRPVTLGDFQEFTDFAVEHFATKDDLTEFKDQILTSNDKLAKKLDHILTEQAGKVSRDDRQDEHISALKHGLRRVETHIGIKPSAP